MDIGMPKHEYWIIENIECSQNNWDIGNSINIQLNGNGMEQQQSPAQMCVMRLFREKPV